MGRKGFPNNPKHSESNSAKDLPCPLVPVTSVVLWLSSLISEKFVPNDPKFLNRTVKNSITLRPLIVHYYTLHL